MRNFILSLSLILFSQSLSAAPKLNSIKKPFSIEQIDLKAKDLFLAGKELIEQENWAQASEKFYMINRFCSKSSYMQEACFYLGVAQYNLGELAESNYYLTNYLKGENNPEHFRKTLETKFAIAEKFRMGEKRRMYDSKKLPAWAGGEMVAIEIYDEITATIPCDELAIQSFFSKGRLLYQISMYNDAVSTLQTLIRRFPKNELAIDSYILIEEIFVDQSRIEMQNTDILELARINLRHFEQDFPKEERITYAQSLVYQIEETFANSLFDIGQLYEKKGNIDSATIYYYQALHQFPNTQLAKKSYERIVAIAPTDVAEKCFAHLSNKIKEK
jgi:hypothetical protein